MWFGTWSGWSGRLWGRPVVALVIAAAGYGLNYWAWTLVGPLGPELADGFGLGASSWVLLGVVAALVGSLARIPAGVLADRFGARPVLPAVSAGAAVFPAAVVPYEADITGQTATTVVALSARQTSARTGDVVAALATLATKHELAIVYAHSDASPGRHGGYPLIAGLRRHLPRHTIIAIATAAPPHPHEAEAIAEMPDIGAVAVAFVPTVNPDPTAILLAGRIGADQVLHLAPDRVEGFILSPGRASGPGIGR